MKFASTNANFRELASVERLGELTSRAIVRGVAERQRCVKA
jgi:hypothetical protein